VALILPLIVKVSVIDEITLNVTAALKQTGLWNNTLVVWMTDSTWLVCPANKS
jgi:hypothetical protein